MLELDEVIEELKATNKEYENFDEEFELFKIGYMLREVRKEIGITQEEIAKKMNTYKSNISRIENHSEDIKLSTLKRFARAVGKDISLQVI